MNERGRRVAVIDIGTNTLLLLVAEQGEGEGSGAAGPHVLRPVREACRFGRLGKGLDRTGRLAAEQVARSLDILREYRSIIDELAVDAVRAVGTQALREARNAQEFLEPAAAILGAPIEVIAGEREAQLAYRSVAESFPELACETVVVADVGGGSTEVIVADGGQVRSFTSIPIGSVRLHERHLRSDPPTAEQVHELFADIDSALARLALPHATRLVGTAGTATTIASVELCLRDYDEAAINGLALPAEAVERQLTRYLELTVAERRGIVGLEPERADVIAAGVAIFARLMRRLDASTLLVSNRGVRWGMAYELAST